MAHIANLAVQALLHELKVHELRINISLDDDEAATMQHEELSCVTNLRHLVDQIHSSPQRLEHFRSLCRGPGDAPTKELILDTPTRWNSTHAMIERACELRDPLTWMAGSNRDLVELSDDEWTLLTVVAHILKVFVAVQSLCADSHPTINGVVTIYSYLLRKLEGLLGLRDDPDGGQDNAAIINQCDSATKEVLMKAIRAAYDKIRAYHEKVRADMYPISTILDPRVNLGYYQRRNPEMAADAKRVFQRAMEAYEPTAPPSEQSIPADFLLFQDKQEEDLRDMQGGLEAYFLSTAPRSTDVLGWWKEHSDRHPRLVRMARDYLAIPATSAPAERVFSRAGDLITDRRGSLSDATIQACMFLNYCGLSMCATDPDSLGS
jgi:hypothetical protein